DARDELALAVLVLVEDVLALRLAHALQDDLLGRLRGDAAEALPRAVELEELAVLGVLLLGLRLILLVVEDLEKELVADVGLEVEALGVRDGDLLAFVPRRHGLDDDDDLEEVDAARLLVELGFHLAMHAEGALGGRQDGLLERLDEDCTVDVLV